MRKRKLYTLPGIVCLIIMLVLSSGVAYARFQENVTNTLLFQPAMPEHLVLNQQDGWLTQGQISTISFSLNNTGTEQKVGKIYLLVSQGIPHESDLSVTLKQGENQYNAKAEPITTGTALHKSFGDGWIYRFVDKTGQELLWPINGKGQLICQVTVESKSEVMHHSILRLVATEKD